jgi:hypothetical protein
MWNDLNGHVDEAFAEHESDMVLRLGEERLQGRVEGGIGARWFL